MKTLRVIGWIWAIPTTLLGLLLAIVGHTVFYKIRPGGVFQFVAIDGPWGWFFRRFGMGAITIGACMISRLESKDDAIMIRHERQHTIQCFWLGPFFVPVYYLLCLWALALRRDPYRGNPLEIQAYAAQARIDD